MEDDLLGVWQELCMEGEVLHHDVVTGQSERKDSEWDQHGPLANKDASQQTESHVVCDSVSTNVQELL